MITAMSEVILLNQIMEAHHCPYYQVLLDLSKAFYKVSHSKLYLLMKQYVIGDNTRVLIEQFWNMQQAALKQWGYFDNIFSLQRGVTQGYVICPTLFNLVIDMVVHHIFYDIENKEPDAKIQSTCIFYADDGFLGGIDPHRIQDLIIVAQKWFKSMGLNLNGIKTKVIIANPNVYNRGMSEISYRILSNKILP